ncbi:hypothetical protein chiPu_0001947 [Chiloscyllium punctatum]|uniref:Uncharacterized protein n=1 Tax=Chiloscyllium punctatum TaxID=137246 RepID=A0A401RZN9_CHIPU|nr:hypothetical protein [Chiloscyllium punctatum]
MEAGLEEAERYVEAAQRCLKCGERQEALRYLYRAQQRYPTQRAKGVKKPNFGVIQGYAFLGCVLFSNSSATVFFVSAHVIESKSHI